MARRSLLDNPPFLLLVWCLLLLAVAGAFAAYQRSALTARLDDESAVLLRLASQRADQHDAHLTALSAIAVATENGDRGLFLDVAATITRFYPRIEQVQLVPFDRAAPVLGTAPMSPAAADAVRGAARAVTDGRIALLPDPEHSGHYLMVKRSPNTDAARYGLALGIDAARLLTDAGRFWSEPGVAVGLALPDGTPLLGPVPAPRTISFSGVLGSVSQPLELTTGLDAGPADLLPLPATALVLVATSFAYIALLLVLRQRAGARAALEQARLSTLESRLAHASRVNALGEMASGMAHELTQPLTAILAEAQAGRRLLERGDIPALGPVLDDTVAQARRASAILERFRNWSRPQRPPPAAFDLRDAVRNVQALLTPDAAVHGTQLRFELPAAALPVVADPVEMEQVVFNLVRNAIDATAALPAPGMVTVTLAPAGDQALLEVADTGAGVPPELRPRLFAPFVTTREGGTGLGLALSQRLVERAGGEISLREAGQGAVFRVVLPRVAAEAAT